MSASIAHLSLLGPLRLRLGEQIHLLTGYGGALLGYLALQPHTGFSATRGRLAGSLWPHIDEERARHLLSSTLYRLQKQLPPFSPHLVLTPETIALRRVQVDVDDFKKRAAANDPAALDLYQGDLLEELDAGWVEGERALLRETFLTLLARLCTRLEVEQPQPPDGQPMPDPFLLARRWVQADPLDEQAHITLIRLFARAGRLADAHRQYRELVTQLSTELGLDPSPAATALFQALPDPAAPVPAGRPERFVGRRQERNALLEQIDSLAAGRGGLILVEGEPGIGKSALLREADRAAGWRQVTIGWGRAQENVSAPASPLSEALHALSRKPPLAAAVQALTPLQRRLLDPLLDPDAPPAAGPPPPRFTAELPQSAALRFLLERWLTHGPLLLLLDDLHWADAHFWTLLPILAELSSSRPLLLLLAFRDWELRQDGAAWSALQGLERDHRPLRLSLGGLAAADIQDFAAAHAQAAPDDTAPLHTLSGGNPLLLLELLHQPDRKTADLSPLLAERLGRLSTADRQVLAAGALLGRELSYDLWSALLNRPLDGPTLRHLVASRFLRETDDGYAFQHDLVRLYLYQQIDSGQKELWHRRAAELLRQCGRPAANVAWHAEQAGSPREALHFYLRAAEQALALRAAPSAHQHAAEAARVAAAADLPPAETLPLRSFQLHLAHQGRPSSSRLPEIEQLAVAARDFRDDETLLRLLLLKYDLIDGRGEQEQLAPLRQEILDLVEGVGHRPLEIEALQQLAIKSAFSTGDSEGALVYARWSESLAAALPERPELLVEAKLVTTACLLRGRRPAEALAEIDAVEEILNGRPELAHFEGDWRYMWAVAAQFSGDWDTAHRIHEESLQHYRQSGNFYGLTTALYNTANSASAQGLHELAILYATEMVALADEQLAADDFQKKLQYRTLLANCYLGADDWSAAAAALAPLRGWLETQPKSAAVVHAWNAIGHIQAGLGDESAALAAHQRAVALSAGLGSISAQPFLALAECCHRTGREEEGRRALADASQRIDFTAPPLGSHTYFFYVRYLYDRDPADLTQAYNSLSEQSRRFTNPQTRESYLEGVPLHRDVLAAWRALRPPLLEVKLARQDAPLGRPLTSKDLVRVLWTIDDGPGDAAVQAAAGSGAVRRRRLLRLTAEAAAQGAAPSFVDLAQVLGVSARTIERDARRLAAEGHSLQTRRSVHSRRPSENDPDMKE